MSGKNNLDQFILTNSISHEFESFRMFYLFEKHMMDGISTGAGKIDYFGYSPMNNPYFLALTESSPRSFREQFIVYNALGAKHAIDAGLDARIAMLIYIFFQRRADNCHSAEEIDRLADQMLSEYAERTRNARLESVPAEIRAAVTFIRENLHRRIAIGEVAKSAGRSKSQLDRDFLKYTGMTPQAYILKMKIEEAAQFIKNTDVSVTELSQSFGFSSPAHFSQAFKKVMGVSPTKYRKRY